MYCAPLTCMVAVILCRASCASGLNSSSDRALLYNPSAVTSFSCSSSLHTHTHNRLISKSVMIISHSQLTTIIMPIIAAPIAAAFGNDPSDNLRRNCSHVSKLRRKHCLLLSSLHQCLAEVFLGIAVIWTVLQSQLKVCYSLHEAAFVGIPVSLPARETVRILSTSRKTTL